MKVIDDNIENAINKSCNNTNSDSLDNIDIVLEHDEYNDIDMKEQSLVISFENNPDYQEGEPDSLRGGISSEHAVLIENTFPSLGNNASSYFAYKKMEMFVHGGDPECNTCTWFNTDTSEVEFLFRFGGEGNDDY